MYLIAPRRNAGETLPGAPPEVLSAIAARRAALEHGIDPSVRPADVAAVGAGSRPLGLGGLSVEDAARARELVQLAIDGLHPRIQSNMTAREAARLLTEGGRVRNVYDGLGDPNADGVFINGVAGASIQRAQDELEHGFFGSGTTVYGTLHFSDYAHRPTTGLATAERLVNRDLHLDTGTPVYGDASVVFGDSAIDRATFLPGDTSQLTPGYPLAAREQLADVVTEALMRHFQTAKGATTGAASGAFGDVTSYADTARDFRALLDLPKERAVQALRHHLTSDAMSTHYIEAQVRSATADDIVAVHVQRPDARRESLTSEQLAQWRGEQDALGAAGKFRGVPVRFSDEPVPEQAR